MGTEPTPPLLLIQARDALDTITVACRLAARLKRGRVHVVLGQRPTFTELQRYRAAAQASGVELTVDGGGLVSLWAPRMAPMQAGSAIEPRERPRPGLVRRLGAGWATLAACGEGVR